MSSNIVKFDHQVLRVVAPGPEGKQVCVFKARDPSPQHLHKGLIVTNSVLLEGRPAKTQIKWDSRHEGVMFMCVCVCVRRVRPGSET